MKTLEYIKHLFIPGHTNNHKAKILHPSGITFLIILLLFIESGLTVFSKLRPDILGYAADISVGRLLEVTNQKRLDNGLPPLLINDQLSQAAAGKANDMFGNNYWAHISPSGKTPWDFIIGANYRYVFAGENLAKDFQDSQGVVDAWMNSPTHKENLLQSKFQEVGFAVINGRLDGEETTLVVQMFGTREPGSVAAAAPPAPALETQIAKAPIEIQPEVAPPVEVVPDETVRVKTIPIETIVKKDETAVRQPILSAIKPELYGSDIVVNPKPKYDLIKISKDVMTGVVVLLILVLGIDAVIVSRKKIVRISGNNFAHILFLTCLLAAVWLVGRGSVI